jgi:hypothetical protein
MCWRRWRLLGCIDPIRDTLLRLQSGDPFDMRGGASGGARMRQIELLVETYLLAERELVAAVAAAGGSVPLPDGRTVTVGRAEFDTLLDRPRRRAWVMVRRNAALPPRR